MQDGMPDAGEAGKQAVGSIRGSVVAGGHIRSDENLDTQDTTCAPVGCIYCSSALLAGYLPWFNPLLSA